MAMQKLAKAGAMGVGSELWIVPNPEASPWARKIDWYLNFQMARAGGHKPTKLSPALQKILDENEIEFDLSKTSTDKLMVATLNRLPSAQVILVPFDGEKAEWIKTCREIWENLEHPSVRLFLPVEIKDSEIQRYWGDTKKGDGLDLTIVPGDLPLDA